MGCNGAGRSERADAHACCAWVAAHGVGLACGYIQSNMMLLSTVASNRTKETFRKPVVAPNRAG